MKSRYLMSTSPLVWIKIAPSNNFAFALKISKPVKFSLLIRKILDCPCLIHNQNYPGLSYLLLKVLGVLPFEM